MFIMDDMYERFFRPSNVIFLHKMLIIRLLSSGGFRDWNGMVHPLYNPFQKSAVFGSINTTSPEMSGAPAPLPHLQLRHC